MKKIYILTAVLALLSLSLNAQQSVTVGDNSSYTGYVPVYGTWFDSEAGQRNQMIYSSDLLGLPIGAQITSLKFYARSNLSFYGAPVRLSIGHTTASSFTSSSFVSSSDLTQVASVTPTTSMTELNFTFSSAFTYNGGNLLIQIDSDQGEYGSTDFYANQKSENVGIIAYQGYNDNGLTIHDRTQYLPMATFSYISSTPMISASPTSVTLKSAPGETVRETVTVAGFNLTNDITVTLNDANNVFSVSPANLGTSGGSLTITYSPTANGSHTATITLSSTGADPVTINLNGTCSSEVTVCDGTNESTYLPFYGTYVDNYQVNQMIYPEISDLVGKKLTSMTFYAKAAIDAAIASGTWTIKLGTTNQTTFASSLGSITRLEPTDVQAVVSGYHFTTGANTLTIEFATPFEYNGGNLLIDFQETAYTSDYKSVTFLGVNQGSNVTGYNSYGTGSIGTNGHYSGGGTRTFLPKVTFTFEDNNAAALTAPASVDVGTNYGSGASTTFNVSGRNLTEALTVSVSGTGFSASPTTISAADANAGTTITVTYNGTVEDATGTLTISSSEVSATVNLTADYVDTTPVLTAPTDVNVGTNEGSGASTTVNVSGSYLTEALTVSVSGEGFSVSPTSISATDANAGTSVTVTYNGTDPNATGTLTFTSNEVSVTVNLTASYIYHAPELTAPVNGSTVDVGTNTGNGVSKTINVSGNYLTQDLTVSVSGRGFSVSRAVTITAADANAGTTVTVTYNGTNPNASGTLTISSSEVSASVHLTASYSNSGDLTICDETATSQYLPIYAYYYDDCQKNQMIYPASMLEDLVGKTITSMTFYANSDFNWSGGQVTARLGTTTDQSSYSSKTRLQPSDMIIVASGFDVPSGGNTWTIVFTTPFEYNGGNLIVDMEETSHSTGSGSYSSSSFRFYGASHTGGGFYSNADEYIANFSTVYSGGSVQNFLPKVTFTYEGGEEEPTYSSDGIIRMGNLIIVDQFWASTAENTHPEQYSYILRYTPAQGDPKESSPKTVDVEHTKSIVNGYYTEEDVRNDSITYNTVIPDKLTADVELTLPNNDNQIYYVRIQGKENGVPEEAAKVKDNTDMVAKLQLTSGEGGFYFIDQIPASHPEYTPGNVNHFMDNDEPGTGTSSSFKTYVPSVMTYGYDRRYFANDTLHNTYGAPVWRTGVGEVIIPDGMKVERQENQWGTTQWEDSQGNACSLFILDNILAYGKLPNKQISNVDYEPYLFRIFVESSTDKLRGYLPEYIYSEEKPDSVIGTQLVRDDDFTNTSGPICIYSEYFDGAQHIDTISDPTNGDYYKFTLNKNADNWTDNAMFGGLSNIIQGEDDELTLDPLDLTVYVRFYYKSKGNMSPSHIIRADGSPAPAMFYGAEGESPTPDPWTAVTEVRYHGEVVGVTYVNAQGMQSNRPFSGLNIVVTRYSDGSITTQKVMR